MKKSIVLIALCSAFTGISCHTQDTGKKPSDPRATARAVALYNRLFRLMDRGVMLGHQDDLAYGYQHCEPGASDVKKVTGDYPAVIGWEIGHLEKGAERSLDSVCFDTMREGIIAADARGGINTISWHGDNIVTGGSTWHCKTNDVVRSVLPGQLRHTAYLQWLDRLAAFFRTLKDKNGDYIPVVFRLYHEHNSSWFWWGAGQCTPEEYIALWRMTVNRLRESGIHHLLFAYSPSGCADEADYLKRYPGDEYVDVVGFDLYQFGDDETAVRNYCRDMTHNLDIVTRYAAKSGKIPAVSETGWEGIKQNDYFTRVIYPLLAPYRLSWVLFWRNAWEPQRRGHFYLPYEGHEAAGDFNKMVSHPRILMNRDIEPIR